MKKTKDFQKLTLSKKTISRFSTDLSKINGGVQQHIPDKDIHYDTEDCSGGGVSDARNRLCYL
jgi:hypothetical protein